MMMIPRLVKLKLRPKQLKFVTRSILLSTEDFIKETNAVEAG